MTRARGLWPIAALALLASAPAFSQPPTEAAEIPAELLVPNEEARAFFEAVESNPPPSNAFTDMPAEEAGPIDAVIRQLATPGEQVPGWPEVGVDLEGIAAARASDAAGSMTNAANPYGVQRTYFADWPIQTIVPAGWVLVGRHGESFQGGNVNIEIGNVSPKLILVMRVDYRRQGPIRCQQRTETLVYSNPNVAASEADMIAYVMSLRTAALIDDMNLCYGADEREPGVYVTRVFDAAGHRLPGLDQDQPPFRIVPVGPFPVTALPN